MKRKTTRNQKLGWILFIIYLILLVYFLFFAESMGRTQERSKYSYNLILFKEIKRFYIYRKQLGLKAVLLNLVGNMAAFVPFGFFLPIISRRGKKCFNTVFLSFQFSLFVEITQLIFRVGSCDVDDLLLNTLGGMLGFILYKSVQSFRKRSRLHAKKKI